MRVHVVTIANRSVYEDELSQMHRLRHRVFVEELGWSDLRSDAGLEIDDFDDHNAVYLLACEQGEVFGSVRLLPTWRRSMINELWPEFVTADETTCGPDIWEWTRWCPGVITKRRELVKARKYLFLAALEYARSRNIQTYTTFCETRYLGQLQEIGWQPRPLGMPRSTGGGDALGVIWDIKPEHLKATRELFKISGSVLLEVAGADTHEPFVRPWVLERLYDVTERDDANAIERLLAGVGAARIHPRLETLAVEGRA